MLIFRYFCIKIILKLFGDGLDCPSYVFNRPFIYFLTLLDLHILWYLDLLGLVFLNFTIEDAYLFIEDFVAIGDFAQFFLNTRYLLGVGIWDVI